MSRVSPLRATVATGLTFGTAALGLAFAPAALAAELSAPTAPSSVVAGTTFTVSGTGCTSADETNPALVLLATDVVSNDPEDVFFGTEPEADGSWSVGVSFPAGTPAGTHEIEAACGTYYGEEADVYPVITLTVTAPTAAPAPAPAPAPVTPPGALRGVAANTPGVVSKSTSETTGKTAAPGQQVVKVIAGFKPNEEVTVTLHSTPVTVATKKADGQGVLTVTFTLPAGTPVGAHDLVFEGNMGTYFQEPITVAAAGSSTNGGLAYTGASIALPLTLGAGLLAAGGGVLVATRRRSAGAPQA